MHVLSHVFKVSPSVVERVAVLVVTYQAERSSGDEAVHADVDLTIVFYDGGLCVKADFVPDGSPREFTYCFFVFEVYDSYLATG